MKCKRLRFEVFFLYRGKCIKVGMYVSLLAPEQHFCWTMFFYNFDDYFGILLPLNSIGRKLS